MNATESVHLWDARSLQEQEGWRLDARELVERDLDELLAWAETQEDPLKSFDTASVSLPALDELARQARAALGSSGPGVAWLHGLPLDPIAARLIYLAIGCRLGSPLENYGRLYDVKDQGDSYRDKPIPVSQTKHTTSFHTDSARLETLPRYIGLLCLQDAAGGDSQLASASLAHAEMHRLAPELLERLYHDYVRDIVTPGTERTEDALFANRFPVFESRADGAAVTLRYMRYWIEKGAERAGMELHKDDEAAMDLLDELFADRELHAQLHLHPGDALFIDNRDIAHNRTPYEDLPGKERHLVRMWLAA